MEEERDLIDFEDDEGNKITLEVSEYFYYEGEEYALLLDPEEDDSACGDCDKDSCDGCSYERNAYIMKVVPVGEDEEEFVDVDEELAQTLIDLIQSGAFDDDDLDEDEDGADE